MRKIKVLQIDGGGIKGIIPAAVLQKIERETGKSCWEQFDMMSGTSTGSILSGMLAAGVPARTAYNLYVQEGKALFDKRFILKRIFSGAKYKRDKLQGIMRKLVKMYGRSPNMGDVRTDFISTTFNGVSGRTHYQMSWNDRHKGLDLVDVISWSALSAVYYFGPIAVPDYEYKLWYQREHLRRVKGAVFFDGGQGRNNCTLMECIVTCIKRGWLEDCEIDILSLGTGNEKLYKPYAKADGRNRVQRIKDYINQSREEGIHDQMHKAKAIISKYPNLTVHRLDTILDSKHNSLDALEHIPVFVKHGEVLTKQIPAKFME